MSRTRLVYVHGAGPQEHPALLKRRLDGTLFGANQLERTILAYYSDLLHGMPQEPGALQAGDPAAAAELESAFLARAVAAGEAAASSGRAGVPGPLEGVTLPDPVFLAVAAIASTDVIKYLLGGSGEAIRAQVSDAIPGGEPLVVIAHSLGTIVAYDVLAARPDVDVRLLVTLGCPLGIGNVQKRIGDRSGPPAKVPPRVAAWRNFADPLDPVALELTLGDDFLPNGFVVDGFVDNRSLLNHDLVGYLETDDVSGAIRAAIGG